MFVKILNFIKENNVCWVDLCFIDFCGKEQYVFLLVIEVKDDFFIEGKMFDGFFIVGWKGINEFDMILLLDDIIVVIDFFIDEIMLNLCCDIVEFFIM